MSSTSGSIGSAGSCVLSGGRIDLAELGLVMNQAEIRVAPGPVVILEASLPGLAQTLQGLLLVAQLAVDAGTVVEDRGVVRSQGRKILGELKAANAEVDGGDVEFEQKTRPEPPDARRVKSLGATVRRVADELGIAPELLATRRELTALLRGNHDQRVLTGWRRGVIGDRLLAECDDA